MSLAVVSFRLNPGVPRTDLTGIRPDEAHVHLGLPQHCAGHVDVVASSYRLWRGFKAHKWWPTGNCQQETVNNMYYQISNARLSTLTGEGMFIQSSGI